MTCRTRCPSTLRVAHALALLALMVLPALACSDDPAAPPPKKLTLFSFGQPHVYSALSREATAFYQKAGIEVTTIGETDFNQLIPILRDKAAQTSKPYDAVNVLNLWVADLVGLGYATPLDGYIDRDRENSELAWEDVLEGVKRKNRWGGHYYSMVLDNDNFFLSYRKDVLSDPRWRDAYRAEKGNELPSPPSTVEEMFEVARFFEGKDWNPDTTAEHAFVSPTRLGDLSFWYASSWAAPFTVMPTGQAPAAGILLFKPDMTPLVDSPGFIEGLKTYLELVACCSAPLEDNSSARLAHGGALNRFRRGEALMIVTWGDPGPQSIAFDSKVKGKVGFALAPGTRRYYDWMASRWVDTAEVHRAPYHAANGWGVYITGAAGTDPESAWKLARHLASPEVSMEMVADPSGGYQPWRDSHLHPQPWVDRGWDRDSALNYVQTVRDTTNHHNAVIDIRIPGAFDYYNALDRHIARVLSGEATLEQAMQACAAEHQTITDRLGRAAQIQAYRHHLGLPD
jgi:multiple sugar transport system substrate-binding protein